MPCPHRRSARRLCASAPRLSGSCYGTKPPRGTLDLHHNKYNDTKLTHKSVTYVVELKCYPCEWRAGNLIPPPPQNPHYDSPHLTVPKPFILTDTRFVQHADSAYLPVPL